MKIVHLGKYYPPEMGGIETATQAIVRGQKRNGHDLIVVCFSTQAGGGTVSDDAKIHRFPINFKIGSQPIGLHYFFEGFRLALKSDAVHIHAPNLLASLLSIFLPKRIKVIVHWHSDIIGKGVLGAMVRPIEIAMIARADAIIGTSTPYIDSSTILRKARAKTSIVPLGAAPPKPQHIDGGTLSPSIFKFIGQRKLVLATGRLVPYKGFRFLIDAAHQLDEDTAIVIAGDGPCRAELQKQISESGLVHKVLLTGRVSDETLAGLFQRASVFCLPSIERSEAFGMVLLEAMSYGVPIVATTVEGSGMSWVNQHNVSGLNVPERDPDALAQACRLILTDSNLHKRLASDALLRYRSLFTVEATNQSIEALYQRLVNPSNR